MWQALMQCCTKRPGNFFSSFRERHTVLCAAPMPVSKDMFVTGRTVKIEVDTHGSRRQIRIGKNMARDQRKAVFKCEVADVNAFAELVFAPQISAGTALLDIAGFNQLWNGITHGFFAAA